jgi:hypothetical protein
MTGAFVICQLGAREHYVLAEGFHAQGELAALCTDIWASPGSAWSLLGQLGGQRGQNLRNRYSSALAGARVLAPSPSELISHRASLRLRGKQGGWAAFMATDQWFARRTALALERAGLLSGKPGAAAPAVFAYSYAALEILQAARAAGCATVLGQIDPGPAEYELVAELAARHGLQQDGGERPPAEYWDRWRQECALADAIAVNSAWSRNALIKAGQIPARIHVAPLAFAAAAYGKSVSSGRSYPDAFTGDRPLRLLFLGQVNLRKGAVELLQAMRQLAGEPVRLAMAGPTQADLFSRYRTVAQVDWVGPVPRGAVQHHYAQADVFILPTHSDGFAITQLEAQAAGLPLLVSTHCGAVVEDWVNGRVIESVTPEAIAEAIRWAIANPAALAAMARRAPEAAAAFTPGRAIAAIKGALARSQVPA